jgi:pyruvate dehydrogenase (quinone)
VPVDFQSVPIKSGKRSDRNVAGHVSDLIVHSGRMPSEEQLAHALEILNSGKKLMVLAGRGAPIAKPLLGKAAVADESPFSVGGVEARPGPGGADRA